MPIAREDLMALLAAHQPHDAREAAHLATVRTFVAAHENFYQRTNLAGQITASAWVVNPARDRVLLIHHRKLERWLQPGGHVEATDDSLAAAVLREVLEETGLPGEVIGAGLYDVDAHDIPARREVPAHVHHDLRLLVEVDDRQTLDGDTTEVNDVRWFDAAAINALNLEPSIQRMWQKLEGA